MELVKKRKEYIFENERPFSRCHASTLVFLPDGKILSAWFGGSEEGAEDVAIWGSYRSGEGQWSTPEKLADKKGVPHWNPVLFKSDSGKIYLFYKRGHKIPQWKTMFKISEDGFNWSESKPLIPGDRGGRGPVKNKPIIMEDGTWAAPASIESENKWKAFVDLSYDQGETWEKSEMVPAPESSFSGKGVIQPTLWESEPGKVHMLLRSTEGCIYRSDSEDNGKTWGKAYPTALPNNNSGIDLTKTETGTLVLAYNPVGKNWGKRTPLILSISNDNGNTWENKYTLEDEEGEYSYPAVISRKNNIYITYTWQRKRIAFWKLSLENKDL